MRTRYCFFGLLSAAVSLGSCASPYFVHDPRTMILNSEEVPRLLKALRCEIATFVAANNQRNILYVAESTVRSVESAAEKYQYYELDPHRFGGVSLNLKIQDSLGLQAGTQLDWSRSPDAGIHSRFWNVGPTLGDQSFYSAAWGFIVPQDTISLDSNDVQTFFRHEGSSRRASFSCYSSIPKRTPPPFAGPYAESDFEALALDTFPDKALFKRIRVNGSTPLAAWLLEVGASISAPTQYLHDTKPEITAILPAQMMYTFAVQVSGGLDLKYGLTSSLWPMTAAELAAGMQQTNTISITLNGVDAPLSAAVGGGAAINDNYTPLPTILAASKRLADANNKQDRSQHGSGPPKSRGHLEWPTPLKPQGPGPHAQP